MAKFNRHNSANANITAVEVVEMRRLYHEEGWTQARIMRHFHVNGVPKIGIAQVGRILRGEAWAGRAGAEIVHRDELENAEAGFVAEDPNSPPTAEQMAYFPNELGPKRTVPPTPKVMVEASRRAMGRMKALGFLNEELEQLHEQDNDQTNGGPRNDAGGTNQPERGEGTDQGRLADDVCQAASGNLGDRKGRNGTGISGEGEELADKPAAHGTRDGGKGG